MSRKKRIILWITVILVLCAGITGLAVYKNNRAADPGSTDPGNLVQDDPGPAIVDNSKKLVMAIDVPLDAPYGKLAAAYKENVEEMSGGSLSIDIYENGLLGTTAELIGSIGDDTNAADIMLVPVQDLADAGCEDTAKLLQPYAFEGHNEFLKWFTSKEADALLDDPEKSGVGAKGLFFAEDGFSHLFLKEDSSVKDKKIAGEANEANEAYIGQIGGVYEYLPSIDIKDALLDGSLDGVERDCSFYKENELWDAAPYIVADSHLASPCEAVIKLGAAEKLTKEEMNILKKAGEKAVKEFTETLSQDEKTMLKEFEEHGTKTTKLKR